MPTSYTRHRVEIPLDLYHAINQAAAAAGMPTSALATMWLLHRLRERRPDLQVRDPYRSGMEQYERRPRRPGELPDDVSLAELLRPPADRDQDELAVTPAPAIFTTVRLRPQEGGIPPALDGPSV